jgi:hypothetical protein
MSAIADPFIPSRDALPVCLCKGNLNGLLTLCEMLIPFFGRDLVDVASRISDYKFLSIGDRMDDTDNARTDLIRSLGLLKEQCHKLGWDRLEFQVTHALDAIRVASDHQTILLLVGQIEIALTYECNHHVFFVLPERYRHLVEHWPEKVPFGPEVKDRFSRCLPDIGSASRCLAFGLYSACVYHLMGIIQEGINAIAKDLGVPVLLTSTWEAIIGPLDKQLDVKRQGMKKEQWKRVEPFYSEALSDLRSIKNAWRNPTMHFSRSYDEQDAQKIFDRTEAFMVHLSTRLRQASAPK